jgi:hypothetical protein
VGARVRRPVAARLRHFHKSCAESERGTTGEVGNGEYFVPQRRDEQQIHRGQIYPGKDTRHFLGHAAAKAVGLDEIDGGGEAGLEKEVGPRSGGLRLEFFLRPPASVSSSNAAAASAPNAASDPTEPRALEPNQAAMTRQLASNRSSNALSLKH